MANAIQKTSCTLLGLTFVCYFSLDCVVQDNMVIILCSLCMVRQTNDMFCCQNTAYYHFIKNSNTVNFVKRIGKNYHRISESLEIFLHNIIFIYKCTRCC